MRMIRALIFDLDNCLAASDEPGREFCQPAFEAIRRANQGTLSAEVLEQAFAAIWRQPLDAVAKNFGFSKQMLDAGWEASKDLEITVPLRGYGDLSVLKELDALRFLVTSGFRRLQESKIRALGVAPLLTGFYVDAIDKDGRKGKLNIFREIIDANRLNPAEVLVVGDSADSEIAAGNRLGATTVQILRPGVTPTADATHRIHRLDELKALMR